MSVKIYGYTRNFLWADSLFSDRAGSEYLFFGCSFSASKEKERKKQKQKNHSIQPNHQAGNGMNHVDNFL